MTDPLPSRIARSGAAAGCVATVDRRATRAAASVLALGGTAADAAIAANAVLAVTSPHLCGMGGDLWAVVHRDGEAPVVLDAAGRAGAGVSAERLRAEGFHRMPFRHRWEAVPVPGCVDGWCHLHARFGRLALAAALEPAIELAAAGFRPNELLLAAGFLLDGLDLDGIGPSLHPDATVRRPGVAEALTAIASHGRDGFYGGPFGQGLLRAAEGVFVAADLAAPAARWVEPVAVEVMGATVWVPPPPSQGYLLPAILAVAAGTDLGTDDRDPDWLARLVAATAVTGHDRPALLHEHADPGDLLADRRLEGWIAGARRWRPGDATASWWQTGDTTAICVRDAGGLSVSLLQSNAADFGAHLTVPGTGIGLHNRGVGFSLAPGHPALLAPGARPPSTLSPAIVTSGPRHLRAAIATMGGDSQPHLLAQHLARLLHGRADPATVLAEPRFTLQRATGIGFDLWDDGAGDLELVTDGVGRARWQPERTWGERARRHPRRSPVFGHAQLIAPTAPDAWIAAAEPRVAEADAEAVENG